MYRELQDGCQLQILSQVTSHEKQPIKFFVKFEKVWPSVIGCFSREYDSEFCMIDNQRAKPCITLGKLLNEHEEGGTQQLI